MDKVTNVLLAGVGGQGILLASEILASVALAAGQDVKQSEVHGMAQRGGSVTSHVRFGQKVHSPTIETGTAHILLSFELLEAARWLDYLAQDGTAIVNCQRIDPMPVASGKMAYPEDLESIIRQKCHTAYMMDARSLAVAAGHIKAVNMVLLGALSRILPYPEDLWQETMRKRVPAKTLSINQIAFRSGRDQV